MKIDVKILERYENEGLLYVQKHNTLPLYIWNYTEKVQFDNLWDELTLMARGLVTDNEGNIIARPYRKFFNYQENKHTPTDNFKVFEKVDGSCIILFNYNNEWIFTTRGSFNSEQAIKAKELSCKYPLEKLDKNKTYIFEIIY